MNRTRFFRSSLIAILLTCKLAGRNKSQLHHADAYANLLFGSGASLLAVVNSLLVRVGNFFQVTEMTSSF